MTLHRSTLYRGGYLSIGLLLFVADVSRTAPLFGFARSGPQQRDRVCDLLAKIQKVTSVISLLIHPAAHITWRLFIGQRFSSPVLSGETLEGHRALLVVGDTENFVECCRKIDLYRPPALSRIVATDPGIVELNLSVRPDK